MRKGIFVPMEIWNLGELHPNERVLLAEVLNFEAQGKECFASNAHFAELLNVSEATARGYISKLCNAGFLVREGDRYNRRLRKSTQTNAQIRADECVNPRKRVRRIQHIIKQIIIHLKYQVKKARRRARLFYHSKLTPLRRLGKNGKSTSAPTTDSNTKPPKANSGH